MTIHQVFITDDELLICTALRVIINAEADMNVIGMASNGADALKQIEKLRPDLVLIDIRMPIMDGITCIKKLKERYPDILILILTTYNEEQYIIEGLANGANGYLLKGIDFKQLVTTIRGALNGQYILPTEVAIKLSRYLLHTKSTKPDRGNLPPFIIENYSFTNRELDILLLLSNRMSIREIAEELTIGEGTVKNYLTTIYQKLEVSSRYEAVLLLNRK